MTSSPEETRSFWNYLLPWRWAWLGWLAAIAFMVAGVPLFLRMPMWSDANLYDVAAYNLLSGGVHYRDVFDTNLPGFVAILTGVRAALGPSMEAARAVDLGFVAVITILILCFLSSSGASSAAKAWAVAAIASFYLFISEFNHLQRDVWMMLPVLAASGYRYRRVRKAAGPMGIIPQPPAKPVEVQRRSLQPPKPESPKSPDYVGRDWTYAAAPPPAPETAQTEPAPRRAAQRRDIVSDGSIFFTAVIEGMIWAAAFWVKPHVVVMAAAAWLVLAMKLAGTSSRPLRRVIVDILGVLIGGLIIGGAGVGWMVVSGTWDHFLEVMDKWNSQYFRNVLGNVVYRLGAEPTYHPPWSMLTVFALPIAVLNILDGRIFSRTWERTEYRAPGFAKRVWRWFLGGERSDSARIARALFSAIYLSWTLMALVLQREFHYVHVPEVILMIGLFALNGWAINFFVLLFQVLASAFILAAVDKPEYPQWRKDWNHWHVKHQKFDPDKFWEDLGWYYKYSVTQNPAFNPDRYDWWKESLRPQVSRELRKGVAFDSDFHVGVDWVQLGAVEDFLRGQNVKDGELLCWHDSPHALYRALGIKPGFRFMHVTTASEMSRRHYEEVKAARDAAQPRLRFVVYDLFRVSDKHGDLLNLAPDGVPVSVAPIQRKQFPMNQPVVFRSPSGRYVVAEVRQGVDLGDCMISNEVGLDDYKSIAK